MRFIFIVLFLFIFKQSSAQDTLSVLFLGNSYTAANNLPQLVQGLSTSAGKTLIYDASMPGGFTISGHVSDPTALAKINQGTWDYIVVQEQSQLPTIDYYRYNDMYPALAQLKAIAEQANPCVRLITYMTWGRRFGGQQCDPSNTHCSAVFVDFNHMQDTLTSAYTAISDSLNMQCAPVGVAWQNVLNDTNLVLHTSDNSHPNLDGSYLAALSMFSCIWKQPSLGNNFYAGITPNRALYFQQQSDQTVWGRAADWNLSINEPLAGFSYTQVGNTVGFNSSSRLGAGGRGNLDHRWDFGDGQSSALSDPSHTYSAPGSYTVRLIATNCIFSDTTTETLQIMATGIDRELAVEAPLKAPIAYPNPVVHELKIGRDERDLGRQYNIYSLLGQLVVRGSIHSIPTEVDTRQWPAGLYLLMLESPSESPIKIVNR